MKKSSIFTIIILIFLSILMISSCSVDSNVLSADDDLVIELLDYLQSLKTDYYMPLTSFEIKINEIKDGKQPLHVAFDPINYYFVCGYCYCPHEYEQNMYCCATRYIWFVFDGETDIPEYYYGAKMIVAFQINKSMFVTDLLSDDINVPNIEHFQIYKPNFENGFNVNPAITFEESFILLNDADKDNLYHSTSKYNHYWVTLPTLYLDEKFYITVLLDDMTETHLKYEFGEYYDALIGIMESERYTVTTEKGKTNCYGLISVESFANGIIK